MFIKYCRAFGAGGGGRKKGMKYGGADEKDVGRGGPERGGSGGEGGGRKEEGGREGETHVARYGFEGRSLTSRQ